MDNRKNLQKNTTNNQTHEDDSIPTTPRLIRGPSFLNICIYKFKRFIEACVDPKGSAKRRIVDTLFITVGGGSMMVAGFVGASIFFGTLPFALPLYTFLAIAIAAVLTVGALVTGIVAIINRMTAKKVTHTPPTGTPTGSLKYSPAGSQKHLIPKLNGSQKSLEQVIKETVNNSVKPKPKIDKQLNKEKEKKKKVTFASTITQCSENQNKNKRIM